MEVGNQALFSNDAVVLGFLLLVLVAIFITSGSAHPFFKKFYTYFPPLLLCYFVPALLNWPLNLINPGESNLYPVARDYLLPASLVLLCLGIDFKGLFSLGSKALIMFFTATVGIIIGGPVALLCIGYLAPGIINATPDQLWKGLSTICGSWIGGGANQTAMKEIFEVDENIFASMLVVDVIVANIWMGLLLYGANITDKIDRWLKADTSAIVSLKEKIETYASSITRIPSTTDYFKILAIAFGGVGLSHLTADLVVPVLEQYRDLIERVNLNAIISNFFWIVLIATTVGLVLSFTGARKMEGAGASKIGSVFLYILVATIGMQMNLKEIFDNLGLFAIGLIWMLVHVIILITVAKIIKAPFFFVAVGSQANVGGAASAPIVASAFSPSLAPVGVLMAVLGYALGTYGAIICAYIMSYITTCIF